MPDSRPREPADGRVPAWDAAVRLLHWALAGLVLFDFSSTTAARCTASSATPPRRRLRSAALGAVARRRGRLRRAEAFARAHARYLRRGAPRTVGHDPLGVWMVWLLWSLVLLLGVTGWMSRLDAFWGDDGIHDVHAVLADALLIAVALHLRASPP